MVRLASTRQMHNFGCILSYFNDFASRRTFRRAVIYTFSQYNNMHCTIISCVFFRWIQIQGGSCPYEYIGLLDFYGAGRFEYWYSQPMSQFEIDDVSRQSGLLKDDSAKYSTKSNPVAHNAYHTGSRGIAYTCMFLVFIS